LGILPMLKHAEKRLIHHFTNCKIGKWQVTSACPSLTKV